MHQWLTLIQQVIGKVRQEVQVLVCCRHRLCLAERLKLVPIQEAHVETQAVLICWCIGPALRCTSALPSLLFSH